VITPQIPDYDSGHSVEGGAASAVLRGFFGTDRMQFSSCSYTLPAGSGCTDATPVVRHFTSFSQAAAENARSRVLVGFHFTHATTVGTKHGRQIGNFTVRTSLQLRHGRR
jgi:PAP2 superfamily